MHVAYTAMPMKHNMLQRYALTKKVSAFESNNGIISGEHTRWS